MPRREGARTRASSSTPGKFDDPQRDGPLRGTGIRHSKLPSEQRVPPKEQRATGAAAAEFLNGLNPSAPQYDPMSKSLNQPITLSKAAARHIWLQAQQAVEPRRRSATGRGNARAVEHLGYVQIDTINVIERCHHHILWTRIPEYQRAHLRQAQTRRQDGVRILDACAVLCPDQGHAAISFPRCSAIGWRRGRGTARSSPRRCAGCSASSARTARCPSATSTMRCWSRRTMPGRAASRRSARCNWRSTPAR